MPFEEHLPPRQEDRLGCGAALIALTGGLVLALLMALFLVWAEGLDRVLIQSSP